MKFFLDNWTLIAVAFAAGAMLMWPIVSRGVRAGNLSANGAVLLINREKAVVVDVSEKEEYATGHIVGSLNVPLGQLEEKLSGLVKNKALPLIMICPVGARAARGQAMAKKLGYENVQVLGGGLSAWREANLPLVKD